MRGSYITTRGSLSNWLTMTSMLSLANSFSKAGFRFAVKYPRSVLECSPRLCRGVSWARVVCVEGRTYRESHWYSWQGPPRHHGDPSHPWDKDPPRRELGRTSQIRHKSLRYWSISLYQGSPHVLGEKRSVNDQDRKSMGSSTYNTWVVSVSSLVRSQ